MMFANAIGRLGREPKSIETKTGTPMSVASLAVDLSDRDGEFHTQWLNLVGFGKCADLLAAHKKGDRVSVSGRCQINRWTNDEGQPQVQLSIVADSVISGRSGISRSKTLDADNAFEAMDGTLLNDDIPF